LRLAPYIYKWAYRRTCRRTYTGEDIYTHLQTNAKTGVRAGYLGLDTDGLKSGQTCGRTDGKIQMDEHSVEGLTGVQMHGQTRPRRELYRSDGRTHGYGKAFGRTDR